MSNRGTFYRLIWGENPEASALQVAINLFPADVERYRDIELITLEGDKTGAHFIRVVARTGGNNRAFHHQEKIMHHPLFLWTEDMEEDATYAYYYFAVPPEYLSEPQDEEQR